MSQARLSLTPRHLQGLLTALGKRSFAFTKAEQNENEAYSNSALLAQMQCAQEVESEIVIIEKALSSALNHMWSDEILRSYLSPIRGGALGDDHNGVAPLELTLSEEQVAVFMKYWAENKVSVTAILYQIP